MKKKITLYYDSYEKNYGDGFYPLLIKDRSCDAQIDILFELIDGITLVQLSGPTIHGWDGDTYNQIVTVLKKQ